ncbi:MAG: 6-carboxytetrahydropterin synthase [bacterium]|nr:6-carboxytetrahydropterin synthase [Candidatus Sumerlaeota bacterium]
MVYITRKAEFCASHRLHNPKLSDDRNRALYGPCNNPNGHGHNYTLEVTVRGIPDPQTGMVMNLQELNRLINREIIDRVDHKNLNIDVDFLWGVIPTAENIVMCFWQLLEKALPPFCALHEVRLWENEHNMAFYRGS